MPRTRGLTHVNLHVSDFDRSVRFYMEVFGLALITQGTQTVQRAGQQLELRQAQLSTPGREDILALTYGPSLPMGNAGLNHIGFTFESAEEIRTALEAVLRHGGTVIENGECKEGGVLEARAYIQDPDGYTVELSTQAIFLAKRARHPSHHS